jgi:MFS family permease
MALTTAGSKRSIGYLLGLAISMFGANFVWISYNSVLLLPLVQKVVAPERSSVTVGAIAFVSTLVGNLVSLLSGILSDYSASRLGRRTPNLLIGALLGFPFIACAGIFHLSLPLIVISYLGMQFFTNTLNGAWWPLLVDTVPESQRGLAAGLQGLYTLIGAALSFVAATYLNEIGRSDLALWLMGGVFAVTGVINVLVIRPYDKPAANPQRMSLWKAFAEIFRVRTRVEIFFWLVFSAFLVNMGFNSLQYFARDFLHIYLSQSNPDAALRLLGLINLSVTMLAAVGSGFLSDKIGRRNLILWGAYLSAVTTVLMALTRDFTLFLLFTSIRSVATGPIVAVLPALASGLAPEDEAGKYMSYNNLSTGVSGAVSSLLFGAILNLRGVATASSFVTLLLLAAAFYLLGAIVFQVRLPQKALDNRLSIQPGSNANT